MRDASLLTAELELAGRLDARFFALLAALDSTGSLRKAAHAAGYGYKGAWMLLEAAGELASQPLLERATGGAGGGGTRLTDAGQAVLTASVTNDAVAALALVVGQPATAVFKAYSVMLAVASA